MAGQWATQWIVHNNDPESLSGDSFYRGELAPTLDDLRNRHGLLANPQISIEATQGGPDTYSRLKRVTVRVTWKEGDETGQLTVLDGDAEVTYLANGARIAKEHPVFTDVAEFINFASTLVPDLSKVDFIKSERYRRQHDRRVSIADDVMRRHPKDQPITPADLTNYARMNSLSETELSAILAEYAPGLTVQQPLKGPGSEKTSPSPRTGTLATWRNAIAASDLPYPAGISLLAKFVLVVANKVAVGGLNPGDALPNVRDLKQICRSSAHPIRQALNLLKEIRLIDYLGGSTRDQDPNFVAAPPYSEPTLEAIRRSLPQSILPLLAAEVQKANERYAQQVPDSGVLPTSPTTQPPPTPPAAGNPKGAPISRTPPTGSPGQGHRGVGPPQ